jgi:hypothetical protein
MKSIVVGFIFQPYEVLKEIGPGIPSASMAPGAKRDPGPFPLSGRKPAGLGLLPNVEGGSPRRQFFNDLRSSNPIGQEKEFGLSLRSLIRPLSSSISFLVSSRQAYPRWLSGAGD